VVGAMSTNAPGVTKRLISFSHRYENYAFIWDGQGKGVYQIGSGLERRPVERRWNVASAAHRGAWDIGTVDVSGIVRHATNRDGANLPLLILFLIIFEPGFRIKYLL
jgi:hypothetical protein